MKKILKLILSCTLIVCIAVSVCSLGGIFASAQAIAKDVSIDFKNADNDWITLSNKVIQDESLNVTIYNFSDDTIILSKIESNGISITFDGWTHDARLESSGITTVGIAGTTNNNAVFTCTLTYYVEGNAQATAETCTAYIYASDGQEYTKITDNATIDSGLGVYGLNTNTSISPVSSGSTSNATVKRNVAMFVYATCHDPSSEVEVYIDGSKYKKWEDFNFTLEFFNDGSKRDHAFFDKMSMSQTSNTGSLFLCSYGTDPSNKSVTSEFNNNQENPDGFSLQAGSNATVPAAFTGVIPTEASSSFTINLRQFGQTGGIFGLISSKTVECDSTWNIKVYNNNKGALREKLNTLSAYGLNKDSYKSGWDAYETALKNAYKVLGTIKVSASSVASALSNVTSAYNNLVRYAVVYTNHYYYSGSDNTNPVRIAQKIDMQVTNGDIYTAEILTNGTYAEYPFNRKATVLSKQINVDTSTNYTDSIDQYYWYVDTAALEAAIAQKNATVQVDEDGNEVYSIDSWNDYEAAAASALTALNDTTLFQADIDEATKHLTDARKALVKLDIDVEWLTEGIGWAANIIDNAYDDDFGLGWDTTELFASTYAQGLYANLVSAYNEAVEVTNDPDFTKAQADRVCVALWQAINNLRVKDEVTKGLFKEDGVYHADIDQYGYIKGLKDKSIEPNGLRVLYNDIVDNTSGSYRLHEADFSEDSWYMLQNALYGDFTQGSWACAMTEEPYPSYDGESELSVPAYSMINNIWFLASQADYNACRDNLMDKVNHLEWNVDYSSLESKLAEAMSYDLSEYTPTSGNALQAQIDDAQAKIDKLAEPQLYGDPEAVTNDVVADTVANLDAAIEALKVRPTLAPATESVEFVESTQDMICGETIGQTVGNALADLIVINDSTSVIVTVYDRNNREMAMNERLATGYKVVLSDTDGDVYETYEFVVKGDVVGDGTVGQADFAKVFDTAFEFDTLEGCFLEAADLNGDGFVDLCDAAMIEQMYS